MKRIAVWNTAFLGDAVLTLPLLQTLRLNHPDAVIDFYVRGGLGPLFSAHPAVDRVVEFHKRSAHRGLTALLDFSRQAAGQGYDVWISAHASARSGFAALRSGAPMRVGYTGVWHSGFWYTHRVDRCFPRLHEIARLLQLAHPLEPAVMSCWPELVLPPDSQEAARRFFEALAERASGPVLGLHPGSVWPTKRWPARHFAEIAARAAEQGAHVLVFAGRGEEAVAEEVRALAEKRLGGALAGKSLTVLDSLTLPELAACLGRLSAYLTNDSGPMHLAWSQGIPVTALFGPTITSLGFAPRGDKAAVLEMDLPCRPCGLHGAAVCPLKHHHCMELLLPDMVWPDVERKLFGQ